MVWAWNNHIHITLVMLCIVELGLCRNIPVSPSPSEASEILIIETDSCMARHLLRLPSIGSRQNAENAELLMKSFSETIDDTTATNLNRPLVRAALGGEAAATEFIACLNGSLSTCHQHHPCNDGGKCVLLRNGLHHRQYVCQCASAYSGQFCQTEVSVCSSDPCQNGGVCHQRGQDFRCFCPPPYYGQHCERLWPRQAQLTRLQNNMARLEEDVNQIQTNSIQSQRQSLTQIDSFLRNMQSGLNEGLNRSLSAMMTKLETFETKLQDIAVEQNRTKNTMTSLQLGLGSCRRDSGLPSGVFTSLTPPVNAAISLGRYTAYCDRSTDHGGWTVIQRRQDGSVDFFRGWNDYVTGFGYPEGEYWLGLETIHRLTTQPGRPYELRIEMTVRDSAHNHSVQYSDFSLDGWSDNYRLHVSGFSGQTLTGEGLLYHNNRQFSTKDRNNDGRECSVGRTGAWWYGNCYLSNLNGLYGDRPDGRSDTLSWHSQHINNTGRYFYLSFVEMKVRPRVRNTPHG